MQTPEIPANETARLNALQQYNLLDTIPEKEYDDITLIASQICGTPISTITLIDKDRQWFKSNLGLTDREGIRDNAFCAHAINKPNEIMLVADSRMDDRFKDNPLVTGKPHVIFYAGVPLVNEDGFALGTLCVIDNEPRNLSEKQLQSLKALGNQLLIIFELRKQKAHLDELKKTSQRTIDIYEQTNKVAHVGGWEVDLEKGTVEWTSETRKIHEVPVNYVPHLQSGLNYYKEGETRNKIVEHVNRAIEKGIPWDAELEIVTAKGNERWIRTKGEAVFENGKCVRLFGIFQDIHLQKIKDILLAQSEEEFRQTFNYATNGMALVGLDGKWLKVNKSLCEMIGYEKNELLKMSFQQITHPDDLEEEMKQIKRLMDGDQENFTMEKRYFHKDGHIVWIIRTVSIVRDEYNQPLHLVSQVMDITDKKHAEQIIKEERQLLITLIDNIPVNIYIKDLDSKKVLVNQKEIEYMGVENETDILGKDDFELYPVESAIMSVQEDKYIYTTGKAILNKETFNVKNDGSKSWFLSSKIPLKSHDDRIAGLLGISYDITQRKIQEGKLKELLDVTSEQNIRLLNFAHIVSHNLRSHSSNFSMLLEFIFKEEDEFEKNKMMQLLQIASNNLTETVTHLNEVVAVTTTTDKQLKLVNLSEATVKVQGNIKALLLEANATVINEVENDININAVPAYLESILLNFFTNAIKYRSLERPLVITLHSAKENDYFILSFQDNGKGIDMKRNGHKLFGMYNTFHGNKDARGVGLFITKNQIEAMGGKIEVTSEVNEGTCFKIFFK